MYEPMLVAVGACAGALARHNIATVATAHSFAPWHIACSTRVEQLVLALLRPSRGRRQRANAARIIKNGLRLFEFSRRPQVHQHIGLRGARRDRGVAAAEAVRLPRGSFSDESRRRRGRDVDIPRRPASGARIEAGSAAAATFSDESRRRCGRGVDIPRRPAAGRDVDIPWRRVAAATWAFRRGRWPRRPLRFAPRPRRGHSAETGGRGANRSGQRRGRDVYLMNRDDPAVVDGPRARHRRYFFTNTQ